MIKEKLMNALKKAAEAYNGGMGANAAVAKAAEAADFNEKQAERLVEMFNTAAALKKQADDSDPTGSCELASKDEVAKLLLESCSPRTEKTASAKSGVYDPFAYDFYAGTPSKTNPTIEARASGRNSIVKQASLEEPVPEGLDLSRRSLYKIINEKIAMLKSASEAADEVVRGLKIEAEQGVVKIAKAIEDPFADQRMADMFKAACKSENALKSVSEYSTKVAESDGGEYAKAYVFDASLVEDLLKVAEEVEGNIASIPEYEKKREFYATKAAEAEKALKDILGLTTVEKKASIADFFNAGAVKPVKKAESAPANGETGDDASTVLKIASLIKESGVSAAEVGRLAEDLEKDAAPMTLITPVQLQGGDAIDALSRGKSIPAERQILLNVRRSILLADLMSNDPIIRDADPDDITQAYKTIVMTAPRVSLDKAQVRAFLRSAANSVAISPSDAKVISDVDRGVAMSNVERLTSLDSSIKDSNKA